jgi:hypothetical protein
MAGEPEKCRTGHQQHFCFQEPEIRLPPYFPAPWTGRIPGDGSSPAEGAPASTGETVLRIDWNENIHLDENMARVSGLTGRHAGLISESGIFGGRQQFLLNRYLDQEVNHANVYLKAADAASLSLLREGLNTILSEEYPLARVSFEPPANVFDQIFESRQPPLVARFSGMRGQRAPRVEQMRRMEQLISSRYPEARIDPLPLDENLVLRIDPEKLLLYRVNQNFLYRQLRTALDQYEIGQLRADQNIVPIVLGDQERNTGKPLPYTAGVLVFLQGGRGTKGIRSSCRSPAGTSVSKKKTNCSIINKV